MVWNFGNSFASDCGAVIVKGIQFAVSCISTCVAFQPQYVALSLLIGIIIGFCVYCTHGFLSLLAMFGWIAIGFAAIMCSLLDTLMTIWINLLKLLGLVPGSPDINAVLNSIIAIFKAG